MLVYLPSTTVFVEKLSFRMCLSVCPQGGASPGQTPSGRQTPHAPLGRHPLSLGRHPLPRNSHCSRWYASYWNAFFLYRNTRFKRMWGFTLTLFKKCRRHQKSETGVSVAPHSGIMSSNKKSVCYYEGQC